MRLINADDLYYKVKCECNPYGKPSIDFESGKKVLNWIEQARTVERPHGEWRQIRDDILECPFCHCRANAMIQQSVNFCSNCGADLQDSKK